MGAGFSNASSYTEGQGLSSQNQVDQHTVCNSSRDTAAVTEDIRRLLDDFTFKASGLSALATHNSETIDGPDVKSVFRQLHAILSEVGEYLETVVTQSRNNQSVLEKNYVLLNGLEEPLNWFMKTHKKLSTLGVSTKIESARLGDSGVGFLTLAQDVDKLALQIREHAATIAKRCVALAAMLSDDLAKINAIGRDRGKEGFQALESARNAMHSLDEAHVASIQFSKRISTVCASASLLADELSGGLHRKFKHENNGQHCEETSLHDSDDYQGRTTHTDSADHGLDNDGQTGSPPELHHRASTGMRIHNMSLGMIGDELESILAGSNTSESSQKLIEKIQGAIALITKELARCADTDREIVASLARAAKTISEITVFVDDIQSIGSEIDLLALNAQVRAAHTGIAGAGLGVLAQAIERLSRETVESTEAVAGTLNDINSSTARISRTAAEEQANSEYMVTSISSEIVEVSGSLESINGRIMEMMSQFCHQAESLLHDARLIAHQISSLGSEHESVLQREGEAAMDVSTDGDSFCSSTDGNMELNDSAGPLTT